MDVTGAGILDAVAARAVPATQVEHLDGWLLRRSPGLAVKRANSVLPSAHTGDVTLRDKLSAVESFYAMARLPVRYQLSPAAQPSGLEASLLARGYEYDTPVAVEGCPLRSLDSNLSAARSVEIAAHPTDTWWAIRQGSLGITPVQRRADTALFARIGQNTAFVTVSIGASPATAALGVLEDDWLGIFNMTTLPAQRGRGAGRAALAALARWGRDRGAATAYLQVEVDNQPARRLYRSAGFTEAYRYIYLSRGVDDAGVSSEGMRCSGNSGRWRGGEGDLWPMWRAEHARSVPVHDLCRHETQGADDDRG